MKTTKKIITAIIVLAIALSTAVTSFAYDSPQKYSADTVGPIPEFTVPDAPPEQTKTLFFLNHDQIGEDVTTYVKAATVFISAQEFLPLLGFNVTVTPSKIQIDNGAATIKDTDLKAEFTIDTNTGKVNGKDVELSANVENDSGNIMIPADLIALITNEKVWYDSYSDTLVITTGKYKNDNILRIINYKFWMNGEPYYEISFNKFDLAYQISSSFATDSTWPKPEFQTEAAEAALKQLHENGFRTIRVFVYSGVRNAYTRSEKQREKWYEIMDVLFDLCDKYEIQMVVCMGLPASDFCAKKESIFDLVCNPESESRQNCYDYIDRFVTRYKDRYSVLMWEVVNEGSLDCDVGINVGANRFSLYQLGNFYSDVAARIKQNDPERLVTGGDSCLRSAQWHLYQGVKAGSSTPDWTKDTLEDRLKAYTLLYHGIDVISVHTYSLGLGDMSFPTSETDPTPVKEDYTLLMNEAKRMGKVLYNGETAVNADSYDEEVFKLSVDYIESMINAGVQLNHWWTFRSDRQANFHDGYGWRIDSGELWEAIKAGNQKIKDTYVINGVSVKTDIWSDNADAVVISGSIESVPGKVSTGKDSKGCGSVAGFAGAMITVLGACVILRKKKEER